VGTNSDGFGDADERNLISGNTYGVTIDTATTTQTVVAGNWIGLAANGTAAGNVTGVTLSGGTTNNTIGGTTAAARNVISGNTGIGVSISGVGTTGNFVLGNYIGTDKDGATAIGNNTGVRLSNGAGANTIGGLTAIPGTGAGNVISGNSGYGIEIEADGALVQGNIIRQGRRCLENSILLYRFKDPPPETRSTAMSLLKQRQAF
jgi:titin